MMESGKMASFLDLDAIDGLMIVLILGFLRKDIKMEMGSIKQRRDKSLKGNGSRAKEMERVVSGKMAKILTVFGLMMSLFGLADDFRMYFYTI